MNDYFNLTKPGIVFGNLMTALAGFFLAYHNSTVTLDGSLLFSMLLGLMLVMASACVCNNCLDLNIDSKMARTSDRALVKGTISLKQAALFAIILGFSGLLLLAYQTTFLAMLLAFAGFIGYTLLYTLLKHRSVYATLVGSLAGALPPLVGYCSIDPELNLAALLLFLIIVLWQMPHFYAIAIYRLEDYKEASIPVLPLIHGVYRTKIEILLYMVAFAGVTPWLFFEGYAGIVFVCLMSLLNLVWLAIAFKGFREAATLKEDQVWARSLFLFSLIIISAFSLILIVEPHF